MNKENFIEDIVTNFSRILKLNRKVEIKKDKKLKKYFAGVDLFHYIDTSQLFYLLRYSPNKIKEISRIEIRQIILHELSHIKLGHTNINAKKCNEKELIEEEYEAEKMALELIEIYYPQDYIRTLGYLKKLLNTKNKIYRKAFRKLYKEKIEEANLIEEGRKAIKYGTKGVPFDE